MTDKQEMLLIKNLEIAINLLKRCKTLDMNIEQYEIVKKEQEKINSLLNSLVPCTDY